MADETRFPFDNNFTVRKCKQHDVLRRTNTVPGNGDCCADWISETRSRFLPISQHSAIPRQQPKLLMTQLDRGRRHNPHPRFASLFQGQHGQRKVCTVATLLPEEICAEETSKTVYSHDFILRQSTGIDLHRSVKTKPAIAEGILPCFRLPVYDDVRKEMLLPAHIMGLTPSTTDSNKYIPRRRKALASQNQHHRAGIGFACQESHADISSQSQQIFISTQGRPFTHKRHVSAPVGALSVPGFDGGAPRLQDNSYTAQMLPFIKVPNII